MTITSADALASTVVDRADFLEVVADRSPIAVSDLADELGTSVSTVNRVVSSFSREQLVERTDGAVSITPCGEVVLDAVDQLVETIEITRTLHPVMLSLADAPIEYDREWFLEATVTTSTPKHPYAPLDRYSELFANASHKRLVGDQFVVPEYGIDTALRAMESGVMCSCVWSEDALARMADEYPEVIDWSADQDNLEAVTSEAVPFDLAILDEHLLVYGFDENGIMSVLVDTDDPAAVEWGIAVFEACFDSGELVELEPT
ncbi:helix-turn-helix transcriptional regulator [Natronobiforma cellulositropha]|uniref:helix-turn-helix transcriptional regulator n=1 Tax=Natronobiforma cellulositropha TaxID=1679076 RepID=UPI0021D5ADA4|nr:hypothetical protein [Natronobiforma cellulositropha]